MATAVAMVTTAAAAAAPAPIGRASLVVERPAVIAGEPFRVAVRLTLPAGWHVYWRNPGDAGAATAVVWTLPPGIAAGSLDWPTPARFTTGPVVSYGYAGDVWLLSTLTADATIAAGSRAVLRADVEWLACADICVPETASLAHEMPVTATPVAAPPATAAAFAEAAARLPRPPTWPMTATVDGERLVLDITRPGVAQPAIEDAWFFPDRFGVVEAGRPQTLSGDGGRWRLLLPRSAAAAAWPSTLTGVLSLDDGGRPVGYAIDLPIRATPADDPPPTATPGSRP